VLASVLENDSPSCGGEDSRVPTARLLEEIQEKALAADAEELAALRFSIVITARWEADGSEDPQRRAELREELEDLRTRYFDKIDHIAMTFGVSIAMSVKDEVEHRVTLPLSRILAEAASDETSELDDSRIDI